MRLHPSKTKKLPACLLVAVNNPAAREIVRRKLHRHPIARQNAYKILSHLSRDVRQHLVLVLQFDAKHGVRQTVQSRSPSLQWRLPCRFPRSASSFPALVVLPCAPVKFGSAPYLFHQQVPCTSRGRVNIHGPFAVTATVCSKCAESLPSAVTAVQSSSTPLPPGRPH